MRRPPRATQRRRSITWAPAHPHAGTVTTDGGGDLPRVPGHDNQVETLIRLRASHLALGHRVEADDAFRQVASIQQSLGLPPIGIP
jgi:hypothetical protein